MKKYNYILAFVSVVTAVIIAFSFSENQGAGDDSSGGNQANDAHRVSRSGDGATSAGRRDRVRHKRPFNSSELQKLLASGNFGHLEQLIKDSNPDDFESIWGEFMAYRSEDTPDFFYDLLSRLIFKGCRAGKFKDAVQLARQDFGPGTYRSRFLGTIFHFSRNPPSEIISEIEKFTIRDERETILQGLTQNVADSMDWGEIKSLNFKKLPLDVLKAISLGVGEKAAYSSRSADVDIDFEVNSTIELIERFSSFVNSPELSENILRNLYKSGTPEIWDKLESMGFLSGNRNRDLDQELAWQYHRRSTEKALPLLQKLEGFSEKNSEILVSRALDRDFNKAKSWFAENGDSLSGPAASGAAAAFAKSAANHGDFEAAWDLVEKVNDPKLKARIEGRVWSDERKIVRSQTVADPAGTLDKIVSGESIHEDYWVKEAYAEWASRSPDEAYQWYQNKSDYLEPEKAQHVARYYAEQALEEGQISKAREWLDLVVDRNFKSELEAKVVEQEAKD